jgi:hypothetical protein
MLVAGYRRFQACTQLLKHTAILATVRTDLTSETARILNFTENLERKNLDILEEARAISIAFPETQSDRDIGRKLNRCANWVYLRRVLVKLPESAQKAAATGKITINDIKLIHSVPEDYRERLLEKIIEARKNGRSISYEVQVNRGNACHVKPSVEDIKQLIYYLTDKGIKGLCIKILTYMLGRLPPEALYTYIDSLTKDEIEGILTTEDTDAPTPTIAKVFRQYTKRRSNQSEQAKTGDEGTC